MVRDVFRLAKAARRRSSSSTRWTPSRRRASTRTPARIAGAAHPHGTLEPDGRVRPDGEREGDHANPAGHPGPGMLRPGRSTARSSARRRTRRRAAGVPGVHGEDELSDEVDLEDYVSRPDKISAADIAPSTGGGLQAVRKNRYVVMPKDFEKGTRAACASQGTTSPSTRGRRARASLRVVRRDAPSRRNRFVFVSFIVADVRSLHPLRTSTPPPPARPRRVRDRVRDRVCVRAAAHLTALSWRASSCT